MQKIPYTEKRIFKKCFERITLTVLAVALLAALFIAVANDIYAFVKPNKSVEIQTDSPMSLAELSRLLNSNGIISNPLVFRAYVIFKDKESVAEAFLGSAVLNSNMSYREILLALS